MCYTDRVRTMTTANSVERSSWLEKVLTFFTRAITRSMNTGGSARLALRTFAGDSAGSSSSREAMPNKQPTSGGQVGVE